VRSWEESRRGKISCSWRPEFVLNSGMGFDPNPIGRGPLGRPWALHSFKGKGWLAHVERKKKGRPVGPAVGFWPKIV
jgi:hypothetical protein